MSPSKRRQCAVLLLVCERCCVSHRKVEVREGDDDERPAEPSQRKTDAENYRRKPREDAKRAERRKASPSLKNDDGWQSQPASQQKGETGCDSEPVL
jgi:hypothetical protein